MYCNRLKLETISLRSSLIFFDDKIGRLENKSNDNSYSHLSEALMVIKLLMYLTENLIIDEEVESKKNIIAVLTPYKA